MPNYLCFSDQLDSLLANVEQALLDEINTPGGEFDGIPIDEASLSLTCELCG